MVRCTPRLCCLWSLTCPFLALLAEAVRFLRLCLRSSTALAADNLFLRKPLALYPERRVMPRRATNTMRGSRAWLARWFAWRPAVVLVQPATLLRWHRAGFRLFWRRQSPPGRPPIPGQWQALIRRMVSENPTWGQERIANERLLKRGLPVSPRTVRQSMPKRLDDGRGHRATSQRWQTLVRHHAQALVACDCCGVVTAPFRLCYVFVRMEHATRRMVHCNVTAHPTAQGTMQQLREALPADHGYRFLLHDRDAIFSRELDPYGRHRRLRGVKPPPHSPQANTRCERCIGTLRWECLDFVIPWTENHLRRSVHEWVPHDNAERPHMSLGPGMPPPLASLPTPLQGHRHRLPAPQRGAARPLLGGLQQTDTWTAGAA